MSHIVTIKTKVNDAVAVRSACNRLNLPYSLCKARTVCSAAKSRDWVCRRYPVVAQHDTGKLQYDNYSGSI